MIKRLLFIAFLLFIPITLASQVRITEKKVEQVLIQFEKADVDILDLKTMRKWKALELSHEMKSQMDYNIVLVKYMSKGTRRTVIIDRNLVPIRYDYLDTMQ